MAPTCRPGPDVTKGPQCSNIASMRRRKGAAFDIIPTFFLLPRDWKDFQAAVAHFPKRIWIKKPLASSRGRGVSVLARPAKVSQTCKPCLIQHYIRRPLLINGMKCDLRLYVAVTSFQPLRVYLYPDGLVRMATTAYKQGKASLKDRGMHLTNVSVNKSRPGFKGHEVDGHGSKWSLGVLWAHLAQQGTDVRLLWAQIHSLVARCMLAVEPKMGQAVRHLPCMHDSQLPHCW